MHPADDSIRHNETFRLRPSILKLGMVAGASSVALTAASISIFFLEEPKEHGFNGEHSVAIVGSMAVIVTTGFTLLCVYTIATYFIERFSIGDNSVFLRSVFQSVQFETGEVENLAWPAYPRGGSVLFRLGSGTVKLNLDGYSSKDRLRIITLLRDNVPVDCQEGWPRFCHKIALPLREAFIDREPKKGEVMIGRRRYDRPMIVVLPLSICVAVAGWILALGPFLIALPLLAFAAWLLLRYSVPKKGMIQPSLNASPMGRTQIYACVWAQLLLLGLVVFGVEVVCMFGSVSLCLPILLLIWQMITSEKLRQAEEAEAIKTAPQRWLTTSASYGTDE